MLSDPGLSFADPAVRRRPHNGICQLDLGECEGGDGSVDVGPKLRTLCLQNVYLPPGSAQVRLCLGDFGA
jgi:hypothetical protein